MTSAQVRGSADGGPARPSVLYKPDRPRAIDRYIDFFGAGHFRADRRGIGGLPGQHRDGSALRALAGM